MLTDKIRHIPSNTDEDETADIFEQSLFTIFGDSTNQHGEPGEYVIYDSEKHGDIKLRLADPAAGDTRFFAHFLWNAGVQAAEMITNTGEFDVVGQTVLELGAGAALPGILSALQHAEQVIISDYPTPEILSNIIHNVDTNVPRSLHDRVSVIGHMWGDLEDETCKNWRSRVSRIIAADCMWMDSQHDRLCQSIAHLLAQNGICLAIAGFHTGRQKVAAFFEAVQCAGLVPLKPIFERDVEGVERPWKTDRGIEDPVERKRWLTIAYLGFPTPRQTREEEGRQ